MSPDTEIAEGHTANDLNGIEPWIQGLGLHRITEKDYYSLYHSRGKRLFPGNPDNPGLQPGAAIIEDGPSISRKSVPDAQVDVPEWVAEPTLSDTALAGNKWLAG